MHKKSYRCGGITYYADDCVPLVQATEQGKMKLFALKRGAYPGNDLRKNEAPGVCSLGYWHCTAEGQCGLGIHRNEGIELTMALTGATAVTVDGRKHLLKPGELMVTRPWQPHSIGLPNFAVGKVGWLILDLETRHPHQQWKWPEWIALNAGEIKFLTRALRQNEDIARMAHPGLAQAFERMVRLAEQPDDPHRGAKIVVAVNALLLELLTLFELNSIQYSQDLTKTSRSITIFLDELRETIDKPWTVEGMAEACGLGVTYFNRHFQLIVGQSPARYLQMLRLRTAARRLREEPKTPIAEIARQSGFPYAGYFSRIFSKNYGCTAKMWRNRQDPAKEGALLKANNKRQRASPAPAF